MPEADGARSTNGEAAAMTGLAPAPAPATSDGKNEAVEPASAGAVEAAKPASAGADEAAIAASAFAGEAALHVCRNCGAAGETPFCGQCGQSMAVRPLKVADILSDVVEDQLSVNGSTVRTFSLLFRPGFLTREYLRGRVVPYLAPVRLFLLSTTFFVLAAGYAMHRLEPRMVAEATREIARQQARAAQQAQPGQAAKRFQILNLPVDSQWVPAPLRGVVRRMLQKQARINALPLERSLPLTVDALLRVSTYLMPLLVPIAAGLVALVYWRRRRAFAEHLVFTLHTHAFAFLVMGLGALGQLIWIPIYNAANLLFLAYLYVALVRVYGDGWLWTVPRFMLLVGLYLGLVTVASPFLQIALVAFA